MFIGSPTTMPMAPRLSISLNSASASLLNLVFSIRASGLATVRVTSETATPMVFSPGSRPTIGAYWGRAAAKSSMSRTGMALHIRSRAA